MASMKVGHLSCLGISQFLRWCVFILTDSIIRTIEMIKKQRFLSSIIKRGSFTYHFILDEKTVSVLFCTIALLCFEHSSKKGRGAFYSKQAIGAALPSQNNLDSLLFF